MKEGFDLDNIGKQMPYQVPSGFFEEITSQTLAEAKRRTSSPKGFSLTSWKVLSVAASVVILLLAGCLFFLNRQQAAPGMAQVKTVHVPTRAAEEPQKPEVTPIPMEKSKVAALLKPTRNTTIAKHALTDQAAKVSKPVKKETLEDLLANISDEELQQLAARAESEEYVYGETNE